MGQESQHIETKPNCVEKMFLLFKNLTGSYESGCLRNFFLQEQNILEVTDDNDVREGVVLLRKHFGSYEEIDKLAIGNPIVEPTIAISSIDSPLSVCVCMLSVLINLGNLSKDFTKI